MSNNSVDLTNCDREPIHVPGRVQSHGFLIVVDGYYDIRAFSENASRFVPGISAELIGRHVGDIHLFTSEGDTQGLIENFIDSSNTDTNFCSGNPLEVSFNGIKHNLIISRSAD